MDARQQMPVVLPQLKPMFFEKNAISVGMKFTKMIQIFDNIDEVKSMRVI
jgi:hypothetical protein